MSANPANAVRQSGVRCDVVARARLVAGTGEIAALRRSPGKLGSSELRPGLLKHVDEQAVVGLATVLQAIRDAGLDPSGFGPWGVVAAPVFPGRAAFDTAFPTFLADGAWGVSPLLISSHSLHSVSGMISLALKAQGPNLGVGGTPGDEEQALLAAATMIAESAVTGVWVVFTGWNSAGGDEAPGVCEATALALTASRPRWGGPRLTIAPGAVRAEPVGWRIDRGHPTALPHEASIGDRVRPELGGRGESDGA